MPYEVIYRLMPKFLYFKYALCQVMGRLVSRLLYFKYILWADLCPNLYTSNMPYRQTYAQIFILQICLMPVMGRLMLKFVYFKYALCQLWADLCPNFYTLNRPYEVIGRLIPKFLYFKYAFWADLCPNFNTLNMPYGQAYAQFLILQILQNYLTLIIYSEVLLLMFIKKKCNIHYN